MRLPLLKCEFKEHDDKTQKFAFRVSATKKKLILAAPELDEMHGWMNALLKQRLFMEETMANISKMSSTSLSLQGHAEDTSPNQPQDNGEVGGRGRRGKGDVKKVSAEALVSEEKPKLTTSEADINANKDAEINPPETDAQKEDKSSPAVKRKGAFTSGIAKAEGKGKDKDKKEEEDKRDEKAEEKKK